MTIRLKSVSSTLTMTQAELDLTPHNALCTTWAGTSYSGTLTASGWLIRGTYIPPIVTQLLTSGGLATLGTLDTSIVGGRSEIGS